MGERSEILDESRAIEAWHFLPEDRRLRWGTREVVTPGSVMTVDPPLRLCYVGLHASLRAINALEYGPGAIISRVSVWGEVVHGDDKLCGQHRKCLWMADATNVLHRFACDVATEALDLLSSRGETVDPRSRGAIEVKLRWLKGEATDEELAAAWHAADAAADDAALAALAAWAAARAANAAARAADAAWHAADAAARAAAMAANAAARAANAANAANSAARAAAWAVAREKQNRRLADLLMALKPTEVL